jgi:hypothetical protein
LAIGRCGRAWALSALGTSAEQPDGARANRLTNSANPYLLQHAHNPVDWYPWGEEAIAKAKKENKTIFVSVGYTPASGAMSPSGRSMPIPQLRR